MERRLPTRPMHAEPRVAGSIPALLCPRLSAARHGDGAREHPWQCRGLGSIPGRVRCSGSIPGRVGGSGASLAELGAQEHPWQCRGLGSIPGSAGGLGSIPGSVGGSGASLAVLGAQGASLAVSGAREHPRRCKVPSYKGLFSWVSQSGCPPHTAALALASPVELLGRACVQVPGQPAGAGAGGAGKAAVGASPCLLIQRDSSFLFFFF